MIQIRQDCEPKCATFMEEYKACLERVQVKGHGACEGQYFDFLQCVDKCAAPQIMKHLK